MAKNSGSVAAAVSQVQRRSNRANRGLNGRDVQLAQLGNVLTAPTRQSKKRFAPDEGLDLENNARAPVKKRKRTRKSNPPAPTIETLPPRQPSPSVTVEDQRYGFQPPRPVLPGSATPALQPPPIQMIDPSLSSSIYSQLSPPSPAPLPSSPRPASDEEISEPGSDNEVSAEPDIDEQSDDEDDRRAHALLRATPISATPNVQQSATNARQPQPTTAQQNSHNFAEFGNETSVLQSHHKRNRPPKPPTFRPSPVTPKHQSPPPTVSRTFDSYPRQWQEVIGQAKRAFRAYVAGKCGFPDPLTGLGEAKECLEDAIEVHAEEGGVLEQGYQIDKDMCALVFAESWQLRSQLKADIRVQVRNLKALFPDNPFGMGPAYQAAIRDQIAAWVANGSYLHDTALDSGKQVHFAHPVIASTSKSFYFDKWTDLSTFDPDVFRGSVPKPLVALIATVYRNVLDEWANGTHATVKFEAKRYAQVYKAILNGLDAVDRDEHHGPNLRERLSAWAGFGTLMNGSADIPSIPVFVDLDLSPP